MAYQRVVTYMATVFRRSNHEIVAEDPMSPVGGDYLNPTPTNAFWSKTFPPGDLPLYVSTRIFTSDGLFPQEADWSPPVLLLKHGEKGDTGANGYSGLNGLNGLNGSHGAPGAPGAAGSPGEPGTSIVWLGDAAAHPVNAVNGQAYKNTSDGRSYVFYDPAWYQMTIDGVDGQQGNDGLSIVWKGDSATPPADPEVNWAYRDTDNSKVYIWTGIAWEVMVLDGSDGANGADGTDGFSVYITYHDSSPGLAAPLLPIDAAGITNGWHTNATPESNWMSQKVDDGTTAAWGGAIRIKGMDGAPGQDLTADLTVPPTPTGLAITSYYAKIGLVWDASPSEIHSHTEIWRSTVDDLNTAAFVGSTAAPYYMDSPPVLVTGTTYYYWIRFASTSRVFGLFNQAAGTPGTTANDPTYMLELLAGKLSYGQFDVANGIFPIRTVTALPVLPKTDWPNDSLAFLTTDKLLYRVVDGAFVAEPDQAASRAQFGVGVLTAGAVLAENIGTNEIIANTANIANGVITNAKIADLSADKINAGFLSADRLAANSINADKIDTRGLTIKDAQGNIILGSGNGLPSSYLNSGNGGNLIPNSDFSAGYANWSVGWVEGGGTNYEIGENVGGTDWLPTPIKAVGIVRGNGARDGWFDYQCTSKLGVVPGKRYEFSGYIAAHRCTLHVTVGWYTKDNVWITEHSATGVSSGGTNLANWARVGAIVTAPANAAYAYIWLRASAITPGETVDPYHWGTRFFFAEARENQTELSPWSPAATTGAFGMLDKITSSNISTYIADLAVDTLQIAGNAVTVPVFSFTKEAYVNWDYSPENTYRDLQTLVVTASGSPAHITCFVEMEKRTQYPAYCKFRLLRNGVNLYETSSPAGVFIPGEFSALLSLAVKDNVAAGTVCTYTFQASRPYAYFNECSAHNRGINYFEVKR